MANGVLMLLARPEVAGGADAHSDAGGSKHTNSWGEMAAIDDSQAQHKHFQIL
eukprot:SAG31_NODE_2048_length_6565_cov_2.692700_3_plen_53_part_00